MNHSCAPSVYQKYVSKDEYLVYAGRNIKNGEELLCDYNLLDNEVTGAVSTGTGTNTFKCLCGYSECRGVIKA